MALAICPAYQGQQRSLRRIRRVLSWGFAHSPGARSPCVGGGVGRLGGAGFSSGAVRDEDVRGKVVLLPPRAGALRVFLPRSLMASLSPSAVAS
jgi:hypothetical protein